MTTPKPVTAYAAVSPDHGNQIQAAVVQETAKGIRALPSWYKAERRNWKIIPVTIIPTEQYEAMVAAMKLALHEMCHTTAPRNSFTDACDALDKVLHPEAYGATIPVNAGEGEADG